MAVKRVTPLPQLGNQRILDTLIKEKLDVIGLAGVKYAIQHHEFHNMTYNLEDSYGYAVYNNGRIVGSPFLFTKEATEIVKYKGKDFSGYEEARKFLEEYEPQSSEWVLVVTAGMFYASFVEEVYGLDVLQGSFLEAKSIADVELKNIKWYAIK